MATHPVRKRRPAPKPNAATLAGLGAERLGELLAAAARSNGALKRQLTLEVARDAADLADEIDRQLQRIRTAKGRLNAARALALARELQGLLEAISSRLGTLDPGAAADRLLDVLDAAPALLARRTGEGRPLLEAFATLSERVAPLLAAMAPGPARTALLERTHRASDADALGAAPDLLATAAIAASPEGRATLRALVEADLRPLEAPGVRPGAVAQRVQRLTGALAQIADAEGDVDAYQAAQARRDPRLRDHLGLAGRLLAAARPADALAALEAAPAGAVRTGAAYAELRIGVLDALGRRGEAQEARWALFQSDLSAEALRSFLKRLPGFDDVEREEDALAQAEQHRDVAAALRFLLAWPDLRRAGALVRRRGAQLGAQPEPLLADAAEQLAHRDPLAATLLFRATIDAALSQGRAAGYARAARHLLDGAALAASIADWEGHPDHSAYVGRLRARYGRHSRFWRKVAE